MDTQSDATKHEGDKFEINDGEKWAAQQLGVNSNVPLVDAGTGKEVIIRQFDFAFSPDIIKKIQEKKIPAPTRQELFNSNAKQIRMTLWSDGLVPIEHIEPRLIIGKKKYRVFITCQPRLGTVVAEKAKTLQELTPSKVSTKKKYFI